MRTESGSLIVRPLRPADRQGVDQLLRVYARCFNADEGVSPGILRRVFESSGHAVNSLHLFQAKLGGATAGGAVTLFLPAFQSVFGSYIFVSPKWRGRGLGVGILRELLRLERHPARPESRPWRIYGEITASSGSWWQKTLAKEGFRFFPARWPVPSYDKPGKVLKGRLCFYPFTDRPPARFSQPAMLAYVYALFYGPEHMHRYLLPRLRSFVALDPSA